jgi:hypothetical protein
VAIEASGLDRSATAFIDSSENGKALPRTCLVCVERRSRPSNDQFYSPQDPQLDGLSNAWSMITGNAKWPKALSIRSFEGNRSLNPKCHEESRILVDVSKNGSPLAEPMSQRHPINPSESYSPPVVTPEY